MAAIRLTSLVATEWSEPENLNRGKEYDESSFRDRNGGALVKMWSVRA